jgi:hypothetical protein
LVHIDDVHSGVVAITCFAIENTCARIHTCSQIQWHSPTIMQTS